LTGAEKGQIDSWINGILHEVDFWTSAISKPTRQATINAFASNPAPLEFTGMKPGLIESVVADLDCNVVLDVGCGMSYFNYPKFLGRDIDFHLVDPLAHFYNEIAHTKNLQVPDIEFAFVEYLSMTFPPESAAAIVIINALDHSFDPVKGVLECLKVLKPGGVLYMRHHANEAERQAHHGLHQQNFENRHGNLVFWNDAGSTNISELLAGAATVDSQTEDDVVVTVITRTAPEGTPIAGSQTGDLLCRQLMYTISLLTDTAEFKGRHKRSFQSLMRTVSNHMQGRTGAAVKRLARKTLSALARFRRRSAA
jgi:SAM-dependent methyltransferase